jgi:hypothetical protein
MVGGIEGAPAPPGRAQALHVHYMGFMTIISYAQPHCLFQCLTLRLHSCATAAFVSAQMPKRLPPRPLQVVTGLCGEIGAQRPSILARRLFGWEDPPPVVLHIDNCPTLRNRLIECLVELPDGRGAIIGKFSNCVVVVDK